jgi:hypothetical protein
MAAIINKQTDNVYISNLKAAADIKNGVFVTPNYANGTAAAVADATAGDKPGLLFVYNVNPHIDQELVADADFVVKQGQFLRLRAPKVGDVYTTDQFTGTYADFNVGDELAVGASGKLEDISGRTPAITFKVVDKVTLYGNNALKVIVVTD